MTESKRLHQKLYILVENELHPSMSQYRGVVAAAHVHLPAGVVSGCKSALDLLHALQNWGKIEVGNYTVLKEILEDARMIALKCRVEEQETLIIRALNDERRAQSASGRQETQPPYASLIHHSGVTVAKQPESALFGSADPHELRLIPDETRRVETVAMQPESALFGSGHSYDQRQISDRGERRSVEDLRVYKSSRVFTIVQRSGACKDWRALGRELGLQDSEIDVIGHDYPQLREQCYQMLRAWHQQTGTAATPKALIIALNNLDYKVVAEEIIDHFTNRPFEA